MPTELARILLAQGRAVPRPVPVPAAIVDTGATWCVFTKDIFSALELSPFDVAEVSTTSSVRQLHDVYSVDLDFGGYRVPAVSALESKLNGCMVQGLIGRNVLSRATFWYDGPRNRYSLSF